MCLYGNTLIPSRRESDKRKGLEYLAKASNQAPPECRPRLWEAYDLALNSNSLDIACEILKLLVQAGDSSALIELGKQLVQDVKVDISEGLIFLWQAYNQGSSEAKTVLWETVEKTKHKNAELNYKTTLHYLSGIGELEATYQLAAHLLKSSDVGDRQSGMDLMRSAARKGHEQASKLLR